MRGLQGSLPPALSLARGRHEPGTRAEPSRGQEGVELGWCGAAVLLGAMGFGMVSVFLGHVGRSVRGQPKEQQTIYDALESTTNDISQSVSDLAANILFVLRSEESNPTFQYRLQVLRGWLERMRRR